MEPPRKEIWFPAKRYGWGWGPPVRWQGWVVVALYFALVLAGVAWLHDENAPGEFLVFVGIITVGLIGICWWKGEPPRWRWGEDKPGERNP